MIGKAGIADVLLAVFIFTCFYKLTDLGDQFLHNYLGNDKILFKYTISCDIIYAKAMMQ